MNASKENARKAKAATAIMIDLLASRGDVIAYEAMTYVLKFLDAAERKLPSEMDFQRAKED